MYCKFSSQKKGADVDSWHAVVADNISQRQPKQLTEKVFCIKSLAKTGKGLPFYMGSVRIFSFLHLFLSRLWLVLAKVGVCEESRLYWKLFLVSAHFELWQALTSLAEAKTLSYSSWNLSAHAHAPQTSLFFFSLYRRFVQRQQPILFQYWLTGLEQFSFLHVSLLVHQKKKITFSFTPTLWEAHLYFSEEKKLLIKLTFSSKKNLKKIAGETYDSL